MDPEKLRQVLSRISLLVSGVTLTGGEPMTDIPLLEGRSGTIFTIMITAGALQEITGQKRDMSGIITAAPEMFKASTCVVSWCTEQITG